MAVNGVFEIPCSMRKEMCFVKPHEHTHTVFETEYNHNVCLFIRKLHRAFYIFEYNYTFLTVMPDSQLLYVMQ